MDSPIEDVEFLVRSEHRVLALSALAQGPQSRAELRENTGVSQSTIGRTLRDFEERQWIVRDGAKYAATELGTYVATAMDELLDRIETERGLRDVWQWLPSDTNGFTIDMCADAVVTVADGDDPYRPVSRFISLLEETDQFRFAGFDIALLEPCKEEFVAAIVDGMQTEIITPPRVARYIRSSYPDLFSRALESGNLALRLHDDLPQFGVSIFDDRVAINGYDPDSVAVRVLVDTDDADTREWAESAYATFRRRTPTLSIETGAE